MAIYFMITKNCMQVSENERITITETNEKDSLFCSLKYCKSKNVGNKNLVIELTMSLYSGITP